MIVGTTRRAENDSENPNRPTVRLSTRPPRVPISSSPASSATHASQRAGVPSTARAARPASTTLARKSGPIQRMSRYPSSHRSRWIQAVAISIAAPTTRTDRVRVRSVAGASARCRYGVPVDMASADPEGGLHAHGAVVGLRAVDRVVARLQGHRQRGGPTRSGGVGLLVLHAWAVDLDRVDVVAAVGHLERVLTGAERRARQGEGVVLRLHLDRARLAARGGRSR